MLQCPRALSTPSLFWDSTKQRMRLSVNVMQAAAWTLFVPRAVIKGGHLPYNADETQSLSWTAEASDGRVYDAFALHRWMAVARCVIPTCCITHVQLSSPLAHSWGKAKGVAAAIHFFAMRLRWQFRRRREGRKRRVVAKTLLWSGESSAFHPFRTRTQTSVLA